jgi:ABC-type phosphate transport system substrate-binding protein
MKLKYILLIAAIVMFGTALNAQVAIIANKSVSANTLNKSKLYDIYSLNIKNWDNGEKIVLFELKNDNGTKGKFYSFIGKSNSDMKVVWMRAQLTGAGFAPTALTSEEDMLNKVANTPGAIGYVSSKIVTEDVKVLAKIE